MGLRTTVVWRPTGRMEEGITVGSVNVGLIALIDEMLRIFREVEFETLKF